ncbi:protein-glutamine gamma-glutamyltransferase 2-like [Rhinoraja longicauda]
MKYAVDFQCEKNNQEHRTDEITTKRLIVRRGQVFHVTLRVDKNKFTIDHNEIVFIAETGPKTSEPLGSKNPFQLRSINPKLWSGEVVSTTGATLVLAVFPPANAKIGRYSLTLLNPIGEAFMDFTLGEFVVLFNPWCPEDDVFLNNEDQRQEYIMNQYGIIFNGNHRRIQARHWYFGQFEEDILDVCLKMLDKNLKFLQNSAKDIFRRNDPVYICRVVSAMVNSNDDNGVVHGRWKEPYDGGAYPWSWNGSVPILQKWYREGCRPVRYGQCWVFAGVACTVLRCLGIPSRVVTNFNSAHDSNGDLIIEEVFDESGKISSENIWNFHVWVEGWMTRNDLKRGYDGWQAVDPTPQERSDAIYCCGPAPVKAIKEGAVEMKYDVPFIFAEVNADIVTWMRGKDGTQKRTSVQARRVGQFISTKRCGNNDREDITNDYKFAEGTEHERKIYNEARLRIRLKPAAGQKLQVQMKADELVAHGSDIRALVHITNNSLENMVCKLYLNAQIVKYTGTVSTLFKQLSVDDVVVNKNEAATLPLDVPFSEFAYLLENHRMIKLIAVADDIRTRERGLAIIDISVISPEIMIKIQGGAYVNRELVAEIGLQNRLPMSMHNCIFTIEGHGLIEGKEHIKVKEIKTNEVFKTEFHFTPMRSGLRRLMVDFDCDKIMDVKGFLNITVN